MGVEICPISLAVREPPLGKGLLTGILSRIDQINVSMVGIPEGAGHLPLSKNKGGQVVITS